LIYNYCRCLLNKNQVLFHILYIKEPEIVNVSAETKKVGLHVRAPESRQNNVKKSRKAEFQKKAGRI